MILRVGRWCMEILSTMISLVNINGSHYTSFLNHQEYDPAKSMFFFHPLYSWNPKITLISKNEDKEGSFSHRIDVWYIYIPTVG